MRNTTKLFGIIAIVAVIGFSMAGCDNGTTPTPTGFTVTFATGAGGSTVASQTGIASGEFATAPADPTRAFPGAGLWAHPMPTATAYTFNHWSAPGQTTPFSFADTPITGNITLTAQWTAPATPIAGTVNNIAAAVAHVAENPGTFTLLVGAPVTHDAAWTLAENVHLTVAGTGGRQTITRTGNGNLFIVNGANRSLTLGDNITLVRHAGNTIALINVGTAGTLYMNAGAQITGNTTSANNQGGGVSVIGAGATFTMAGGEIWGNTGGATAGGGVRVGNGASFVMQAGAVIWGNTAQGSTAAGGVFMIGGGSSFTMLGGEIRGNEARVGENSAGGVRVATGTFRIVNGVIHGTGDNANDGTSFNALEMAGGTAQYGTFVGETWTPNPGSGTLVSDNTTIRVVNGVSLP